MSFFAGFTIKRIGIKWGLQENSVKLWCNLKSSYISLSSSAQNIVERGQKNAEKKEVHKKILLLIA